MKTDANERLATRLREIFLEVESELELRLFLGAWGE